MSVTRAIGYIRVSTDEQTISPAAQRQKLEAYAGLFDIEIVEFVEDLGVSAKTLDRPGLTQALELLAAGRANALLVTKLDRLTRSVVDLGHLVAEYFAEGKAALMSVGEQIDTRSAGGRLVLNVLGSVSQWEREVIGERTSAALRHKQAEGEYIGGGEPFGYRLVNDVLEENGDEQAIIAQVRELRAQKLSFRAISARLAEDGVVARNGRPFAAMQVSRIAKAA